ncbi:MAG: hypothetical protein ACRDF4_00205, partial [Rhabdochlamydiaceae bacterium]
MSDALSSYVLDNYSKAVKMELSEWLLVNPLPSMVERKFDGVRIFLFKSGDKLVVSTKHGGVFTPKGNPKVFAAVPEFTHAPHRMILDGEYVSSDGLHLFDVIQVDDRDVRSLVLEKRKEILSEILTGTGLESQVKYAKSFEEIRSILSEIVAENGEGVICKNPLSTYGQPNSWLKMKRFDTIDCFVMDYEKTPEMERSGIPRSWFVGVYDESEQIVNIGKVGSFIEKIDPRNVKIGSVIEVRFQEFTHDKKLRAPFIIRI